MRMWQSEVETGSWGQRGKGARCWSLSFCEAVRSVGGWVKPVRVGRKGVDGARRACMVKWGKGIGEEVGACRGGGAGYGAGVLAGQSQVWGGG